MVKIFSDIVPGFKLAIFYIRYDVKLLELCEKVNWPFFTISSDKYKCKQFY